MSQEIVLKALKLNQPLGEFIIGTMSARDLVAISHADVRRIADEQREVEKYLGIQRPLDRARVKKIKEYLTAPDAAFPTGVILAVKQECAEFDESVGELTLQPHHTSFDDDQIPLEKIARVLDGQHRIGAFTTEQGDFDESMALIADKFEFNVVIYIGLDIDEQANIFATVNLAQTKVNKSLVYDLEGLSKTRSPFRTCHQIAVALDSADSRSPLYHRIKRLGVKTKGRDTYEPLTQAAFVESLMKFISPNPFTDRSLYMQGKKPPRASFEELKKFPFRNLFIDEKDTAIAITVYNYFRCVQQKWPDAWEAINQEGNILPRSNAFKALMRYLKIIYPAVVQNIFDGPVPSPDDFNVEFSKINVSDHELTSANFSPGSGGESAFFKLLKGEVTIQELKDKGTI